MWAYSFSRTFRIFAYLFILAGLLIGLSGGQALAGPENQAGPEASGLVENAFLGSNMPEYHWARRFGGTGYESGYSAAVDGSGNVFVTGMFEETVNFGGGGLTSANSWDIFLAKFDTSGSHLWSKSFGGTGVDSGSGAAVDGSGNVFVTGYFNSTVNFGGGGLTSAGSWDIFLAKYNANGDYLWSKGFGGIGDDRGFSTAVDGSGNIFITGYFNNTVNFGEGGLTAVWGNDIFLAKYNANGDFLWSKRFGGKGDDRGYSAAVDSSGSVFLTGYCEDTVDFGGGDQASVGARDIFLAKYDANGNYQWSRRFGGSSEAYGTSTAVDSSGNVFVTGYFWGTVHFESEELVSAGYSDIYLASFDGNGMYQWSRRFGGTDLDYSTSIAVDGSGSIFMTGTFQLTANFGGGGLTSAGQGDLFLAKYDTNGSHLWSRRFGGTEFDYGYSAATDDADNIFVTGYFRGTSDFGGGWLTGTGGWDIFLAKYGPYNYHVWVPVLARGN